MLNPQAIQIVRQYLSQLAATEDFEATIASIFGTEIDRVQLVTIRQQWLNGDFSIIPNIDVLTNGELGTANGAYAASLDRILVSADFLAQHSTDPQAVAGLLLEEIGHKLDRVLNGNIDSPGDEGAIFRSLATGQILSSEILAGLRAREDRAVITVDGQAVEVEQQDFNGDAGNNTLIGTSGNDNFYPGTGADTIDGAAGEDYLFINNYSPDTANTTIVYTTPTNGSITGGSNNGTTFKNIERIYLATGSGNDNINISATTVSSQVIAGAGNDSITGGAGDDIFFNGAAGDDFIYGLAGNDNLYGGIGNDNLYGGIGNDRLYGNDISNTTEVGNDNLYGEDGNDVLNGGAGNDNLNGDSGDDTLFGGDGNDVLNGGDGNDDISYGVGMDTIDGGAGNDSFNSYNERNGQNETSNITIIYTTTTNGSIIGGFNNGTTFKNIESGSFFTGSGDDNINVSAITLGASYIRTGAGNDTIVGATGARNIIEGEGGDDNITGSNINHLNYSYYSYGSADQLYGGDGNDTLSGLAGEDSLRGGDGNDIIYGGDGNDFLNGGNGDDVLNGDAGSDFFYAGTGNNTINGGDGTDQIYVTGVDTIDGGAANDYLIIEPNNNNNANTTITYTNASNGSIVGGFNNGTTFKNIERVNFTTGSGDDYINISVISDYSNKINAGAGNDIIIGGVTATFQELYGGEGNDNITGGGNSDYLYGVNPSGVNPGIGELDNLIGGAGSDYFILGDAANIYYDDRNTATNGNNDYATIADFNSTVDKVRLQGLASNYLLEVSGANTNLYIDKAGSEPDELIGVFQNVTRLNLTSSDFQYIAPVNTVAFSSGSYSVNENGTAQVTLIRTGSTVGQSSVSLTLANGTATAPTDYDNTPISVTFNAGENSKVVTIPIVDNNILEPDETIDLALTNPSSGLGLGTQRTATFTILNDDLFAPIVGTPLADHLIGTAGDDTIFGLAGNDILTGGAGSDILTGGAGIDSLFGGAGNDIFVFNSSTEGIDKINDFGFGNDILSISRDGFGGASVFGSDALGALDASRFTLGTIATSTSQRFIYNNISGALFFDADGLGGNAQVRLAQFVGSPTLSNNSFSIF